MSTPWVDDLVKCKGCQTYQHACQKKCPKCGWYFKEEDRVRADRLLRKRAEHEAALAKIEAKRAEHETALAKVEARLERIDNAPATRVGPQIIKPPVEEPVPEKVEWSKERLEEAKETLARVKAEASAKDRMMKGIARRARKAKERSDGLARLCISRYEHEGTLPPAATMVRLLYIETGIVFSSQTMISYLKQFGYERIKRGWRKVD